MANRSSSTKSNSTRLIVPVECLNAFSQIDEGDMKLQHLTTEVLPESITSLKDRVFAEHKWHRLRTHETTPIDLKFVQVRRISSK
jgi:hypothetical protein